MSGDFRTELPRTSCRIRIGENMKKERNLIHIEFIRIFAAFFVIFNHTGNDGFFLFVFYDKGSLTYWAYMFLSVLCKISVPLFFMIAGALLLRKDMSFKKIWSEKIMRMALALFIFSVITYIGTGLYSPGGTLSVGDFFYKLYAKRVTYAYWYIYAYIALLMTLPFLRAMVKNISENYYRYLIVLYIVFVSVIPCLEYRLSQGRVHLYQQLSPAWILADIVFWPLLGYYLENVYDWKKCTGKTVGLWALAGVAGIMAACYMINYMYGVTGECTKETSQTFHSSFIVFPCIAIYVALKYFWSGKTGQRVPGTAKKIITSLGGCTFGIYLLHMLIKEYFSGLWNVFREDWHVNHMLSALLVCASVFAAGYVLTLVLKKVPGLRRLL